VLLYCVVAKQVLRVLWFCMSYGNSCANPIIYNYASTDFRAGFRRAVYRLLVCLPRQPGGAESPTDARCRIVAATNTIHMSPRQATAMTAVRVWNAQQRHHLLFHLEFWTYRCTSACLSKVFATVGANQRLQAWRLSRLILSLRVCASVCVCGGGWQT